MAPDNISSIQMESSSPSNSALEDELASLIRVRNRLAKSSDASLPNVFTGLLPRLLVRLEDSSYQHEVVSSNSLRAQIRGHLLGILTHALERIRGKKDMPIPWLPNILVSLESDSQVVRTMTLSFVQAAMPKCSRTSVPAEALLRAMDRSHKRFLRDELSEAGRLEWRTTGWLLLDAIAVMSGLTPMIDWDLDCDSEHDRLGVFEPPQGALATAPIVSPGSIQAMNEDGSGVWNLLLDLMLFGSAAQNVRVPQHDAQEVVNGGVSVEGIGRMAFRLKDRSSDSMTHLQYLKAACFSFAVSKEHPCLFQGEKGSVGASRALMLSVLLMNSSKAGKLATDYVNIHLTLLNGGFTAKKQPGCSLAMACSMFLLVLGDAASAPITDQYWNQKNLWIILLGPRPSESTAMRPPLAPPISARVIEFISNDLLLSVSCSDEGQDAMRLLVDLAVAVQQNHSKSGVWAIGLMYALYKQLSMTDDNHWWMNEFCEKCLTCARDTLSSLSAESTVTSRAILEDNRIVERNWRQARDRAEDELFTRHRRALRKKRLQNDDATKARKIAYELVISLGSYAAKATGSEEGNGRISFDLAIVLFKCALFEDTTMKTRAIEALCKLLAEYKSLGGVLKETCTLHQVALLIPSLVDAACCDFDAVRLVSAQWTVELLVLVDPAAANYLCWFLADDVDSRVSGLAKLIVQDAEFRQLSESNVTEPTIYEYLDLSTQRDLDTLTMELNIRISSIARDLDIPSSAASVLLLSFNGSPKAAVDACSHNREDVFQKCGIKARCDAAGRPPAEWSETGKTFVCAICYDDEITSANSYAMTCGHRFCMECWQSFLENKLEEGPTQILNATCPYHDCTERVTGVEVHEIIPQQVSKWKELLLRQFVNQESHHRFCSGPDCEVVIVAIGDNGCVTCNKCHTSFCIGCGEPPHIPAQCDDLDKWKAIFGSSQFWVAKHAKPCPGCSAPIEKNQGCNHMHCSRCNTGFCWLCLGRLDGHRAHTCNRYDPAEHAEDDDEKMALFFTDRFQAHEEAEEFARRRVEGIENKVQHLLDKNWLLFEEDALERVKAEETLVECRHFLKYSYVAAYGMKDDQSRREVFECHQGALELLTETLSGLTELSLDTVYLDRGENALHLHLRAISFYTSIVSKYMERIVNLHN